MDIKREMYLERQLLMAALGINLPPLVEKEEEEMPQKKCAANEISGLANNSSICWLNTLIQIFRNCGKIQKKIEEKRAEGQIFLYLYNCVNARMPHNVELAEEIRKCGIDVNNAAKCFIEVYETLAAMLGLDFSAIYFCNVRSKCGCVNKYDKEYCRVLDAGRFLYAKNESTECRDWVCEKCGPSEIYHNYHLTEVGDMVVLYFYGDMREFPDEILGPRGLYKCRGRVLYNGGHYSVLLSISGDAGPRKVFIDDLFVSEGGLPPNAASFCGFYEIIC